ncbi:restriction endonuclease subunit S [Fundicoccus culcitae]|uniref:Restriction endonuclease subunit S n=1 Tax=Fundicoccus culcitae TaxID=2969821 RepID=A0ABY5P7W6_9LACT|nr:restriction endonuclease subunit S [Fundicoccus culcitae]UUX34832.1 restriction endonuclease subunit S [Fundicoccus culcitae]
MVTYPVNWYENRLGDVCKYVNGTALEEYFSNYGNRRVISLGNYSEEGKYIDDGNRINLNQKTQSFLLFKDDLSMVLNDKGNGRLVGKVLFIDENDKYIFNQRSLRIVPEKNKVAPLFLYHLINSGIFRDGLKPHIQGNTQVYINPPAVMSIPIYLPSLQEQQTIASVLSDFDEHIDNLSELIEKKKAIRDGALEDLVSGRIRLDGFNGEWINVKLSDFAQINPSSVLPEVFKYVDLESVKGITLMGWRDERKETAPSRAKRLAQFDDIFFQTVRPYQRNNYLFELSDEDVVFSTGYAQLRTKNDARFLFLLLRQDDFVNEVLDNCTGTSYPAINPSKLSDIKIYVPIDKNEQQAIAEVLTAMDEEIESLKIEKEKMIQIKEGAMDDLLTGRVRLKV